MTITQFCATGFMLVAVLYGFSYVSGLGVDGMLQGIALVITRFV